MKPIILTTQHIKPTHLHSHLLLPPHTGKHSKAKRVESNRPLPQNQTVNNVDNSVYSTTTTLRTDRRAADNSTYPKGGVWWPKDRFVVNETFVL